MQTQLHTLQNEHSKDLASVESNHQSFIADLESRLDASHRAKVAEIRKTHTAQVAQLEADAASALASLSEIEASNAEAVRLARDELSPETAEQIRGLEQNLRSAKEDAEAKTMQIHSLQSLKGILAQLEEEGKQAEQDHEEERNGWENERGSMVLKMSELQARMADTERDYAQRLSDARLKNEQEWQSKVDDLEKRLSAAHDDKSKATSELEDRLRGLERELVAVSEKVATAANVPTPAATTAEPLASPTTSATPAAVAAPLPNQDKSRKASGLGASRWASKEDNSSPSTPRTPPSPSARALPAAIEATPVSTTSAAHDEAPQSQQQQSAPTKPSKPNVAGSLKGIEEQIRQLDALSEEFLEEHEKMAGMLSRATAAKSPRDDGEGLGGRDRVGSVGNGGEA
jgi:hypothetical protein